MTKPRELSKLLTSSTNITTDEELISTVNSASAYALSEANDYTDNELSSIDLTSTINTASAAAFASASAYTDSAIASFEALPSQTGNAGKYLSTSGSVTSWEELDLNAAINTASAAAYASASAYTDTQISNIDLSATIQTASAAAVTYLVDSAPGTLDTLNELSQALNDDPNFYSTIASVYLTQSSASSTYATKAEAQNSINRWTKIYSASATTISGADDSANSLSFTPNFENLYINGILIDDSNYTATSGSTILLNYPLSINDVVDVISLTPFSIANAYTKSEIDSKYNSYTRWVKTLSASATNISGDDDNLLPLLYNIGYELVYINGILLKETTDYTTTSASVITLVEPALSGDTIEVITVEPFNIANTYTTTQSDDIFLNKVSASSTYLTQTNASSTYLTQSSASSLYLTQSSASINYLTQSSASNTYALKTNETLTSPTITDGSLKDTLVKGLEEDISIVASAATGTINLDIDTASILYYTSNATANHTLNIRYNSSTSLNSKLPINDTVTVVWMNTNGSTAYRPTTIQIDGSSVTPLWLGGVAPTSGNASSIDVYTFTIIKTNSATYTVLGSQSQYKA